MNYYVYYKVAAGRAETLRAQVDALFALVEKRTGVRGRWMRRRDDPQTYMEVYEGVRDAVGFEHHLALAVQAAHFDNVMEAGSARHMECFED